MQTLQKFGNHDFDLRMQGLFLRYCVLTLNDNILNCGLQVLLSDLVSLNDYRVIQTSLQGVDSNR